MIIGTDREEDILALMESVGDLKEYLDTHDDLQETILLEACSRITRDASRLLQKKTSRLDPLADRSMRRIRRETERYLSKTTGEWPVYRE